MKEIGKEKIIKGFGKETEIGDVAISKGKIKYKGKIYNYTRYTEITSKDNGEDYLTDTIMVNTTSELIQEEIENYLTN